MLHKGISNAIFQTYTVWHSTQIVFVVLYKSLQNANIINIAEAWPEHKCTYVYGMISLFLQFFVFFLIASHKFQFSPLNPSFNEDQKKNSFFFEFMVSYLARNSGLAYIYIDDYSAIFWWLF